MSRNHYYSRHLTPRLRSALRDTPAVLIHGPRQCGKTTLAKTVGEKLGYSYITFDDDATRMAAKADPVGFVARLPTRTILDEVQRAPEIFTSIKASIDSRRSAGRFILTGSANVLLIPDLADSLAGRMGILRLHPLSQSELEGHRPRFIQALLRGSISTELCEPLGRNLALRIARGGFPAALVRKDESRQRAWYRDYVETHIQRDVRDLSRIRSLDTLPKLLRMAASHTSRLVNVADLAAPFELTRQSIHEHVTLLERVFLVERLPSWHTNQLSRLVKRAKLHLCDTGMACAILGVDARQLEADRTLLGAMLETFILQELRRQSTADPDPVEFYHFRDRDDYEVDIVIEGGGLVAGVEVKAASTVNESDLRGLRKLQSMAGKRFSSGVVLYDGSATIRFGNGLFAVPIRKIWETI
ncbi:MAG: ATP-binding protein [Candidatus Kapabacteria bacterium]|nr:ATP-binding protein [Candidatus Kapabacteria bacterium]